MLCSMLRPVLPAAVKNGLCIAASNLFLVSCGSAPRTGCPRRTRILPIPRLKEALLWNWLETSSKLIESSLGNVFFGFISFLTCAGCFGAAGGAAGFGITGATAGVGGGAIFGSCGAAVTLACALGGGALAAAVTLGSEFVFRNRDWKFSPKSVSW